MRKLLFILMVLPFTLNVRAEDPPSMLEKAVSNIKRWEGWHRGKMPYIGFGHRLLPHEKLTENLSEAQADSLLRCDLERCLKVFRKYGKDSLLLSLLGFNVGCYRLIGNGKIPKSRLIQKLESGDRDIYGLRPDTKYSVKIVALDKSGNKISTVTADPFTTAQNPTANEEITSVQPDAFVANNELILENLAGCTCYVVDFSGRITKIYTVKSEHDRTQLQQEAGTYIITAVKDQEMYFSKKVVIR